MAGAPDRWRIYGLALREAGGTIPRGLRRLVRLPRLRAPRPERLLFAPQDLRTADPVVAEDVYAGLFTFAGRSVQTGGRSPFAVAPPSDAWSEVLYGFGWLRHLKAAETQIARDNARALVAEAVGRRRRDLRHGSARRTKVVARRLVAFLCQSPLVLVSAEHELYTNVLRAIGRDALALERDLLTVRKPSDRLAAAIALSYAALCCGGLENRLRGATQALSRELDAQILPDGGHVSRHPGILVDILLDVLPLRLIYASRGIETPPALTGAIDRIMPMLRHLRHRGGEIALFNGMGHTPLGHVATVLSHDDTRGLMSTLPPTLPPASGYARMAAGDTIVLCDVGAAPRLLSSAVAHAGCLSFEMSCRDARLVVNGGAPKAGGRAPHLWRETAAHSTLELGRTSSARILADGQGMTARWLLRRLGPVVALGPARVETERHETPDGIVLTARHDGYSGRFGILHERRLRLSADGTSLEGEDRLVAAGGSARRPAESVLRFHLHPAVQVLPGEDDGSAALSLPDGTRWRFSTASPFSIEESVFYGGAEGWRPTRQIVLRHEAGPLDHDVEVTWRLAREDPVRRNAG